RYSTIRLATRLTDSASATEDPPNFWTSMLTAVSSLSLISSVPGDRFHGSKHGGLVLHRSGFQPCWAPCTSTIVCDRSSRFLIHRHVGRCAVRPHRPDRTGPSGALAGEERVCPCPRTPCLRFR